MPVNIFLIILGKIKAYSSEKAYTIFETMNDRGLSLTPTEMLKGFLLSMLSEQKVKEKTNKMWKDSIQKLHVYDKDEEQQFIKSWLEIGLYLICGSIDKNIKKIRVKLRREYYVKRKQLQEQFKITQKVTTDFMISNALI